MLFFASAVDPSHTPLLWQACRLFPLRFHCVIMTRLTPCLPKNISNPPQKVFEIGSVLWLHAYLFVCGLQTGTGIRSRAFTVPARVQSSPALMFFLIFLQRGARPTGFFSSNEYVQCRSPPILMLLLPSKNPVVFLSALSECLIEPPFSWARSQVYLPSSPHRCLPRLSMLRHGNLGGNSGGNRSISRFAAGEDGRKLTKWWCVENTKQRHKDWKVRAKTSSGQLYLGNHEF